MSSSSVKQRPNRRRRGFRVRYDIGLRCNDFGLGPPGTDNGVARSRVRTSRHDGVVQEAATPGRSRGRSRGGREAVVAAAMEQFCAQGFHATSMRDIAGGAGMTVASIYHHFSSKQRILEEIMVSSLRDSVTSTRAAVLDAGSSATAQLRALVASWVGLHIGRQPEALIGASELRGLDESGRTAVDTLRREQARIFYGVVEHGVRTGEFRTAFPRECARGIAAMGAAVASWYEDDGTLSRDEVIERMVQLSLDAAGVEPDATN